MPRDISELRLEDFQAFLFDLDGTLIGGSDRHFVECVFETGKEFGRDELRIPAGAPLTAFLRREFPNFSEEKIQEFRMRNRERMRETPRPIHFHADALEFVRTYAHMPRAIVTNCSDWELEMTERYLNLRELFELVIYKTPETEPKPAADLYLKTAEILQIAPERCLIFEDSAAGIQAGKNAAMTVIAIDRGVHRDFKGADFLIRSFHELL